MVASQGAAFMPGRGFYEVSRTEDVSAGKEVVVEQLDTGAMFAGDEARRLVGLDPGVAGKVNMASVPAGYRAYVQSTSSNRKLQAGTHFLYELSAAARGKGNGKRRLGDEEDAESEAEDAGGDGGGGGGGSASAGGVGPWIDWGKLRDEHYN